MDIDSIEKKLEQLEELYSQMKSVLEWKKLKVEETNRNPSSRIPFYDNSFRQLVDLKGRFFSESIRLRQAIWECGSDDQKIHQLINKLTKLENQVHYLESDIRIL